MSVTREDYLTLSAMLRAREPRMLTNEKASVIADAASVEDAARQLADSGLPDMSGMDADRIETALAEYRSGILCELDRLCPDRCLVDAFRMKYDYHNAKALIKAEAAGLEADSLLSELGRYSPERLRSDYHDEKYTDWSETFSNSVREAKSVLAGTSSPQLSDVVLDRAYFTELKKAAESLKNDYFTGYVRLLADSANLRAAVRTFRMGRDSAFLADVLTDCGIVSPDRVLALSSVADIAALYGYGSLAEASALAESAAEGKGMTAFEKACENAVTEYLKKARYVTCGPETVVAYLSALETQVTAARMLLTGRLSGIPGSVIKERLRDMYA